MPRKNLFNNLKDYNNELEKVLEKKRIFARGKKSTP